MDDLDHQSEGIRKTSEESPLPLVDKADVREEPVKRKRGRPKLAEGEKGNYRVSAKERARRASAAAVRNADRAKKKAQKGRGQQGTQSLATKKPTSGGLKGINTPQGVNTGGTGSTP